MRSFLLGLALLLGFSFTVLSLRPGGLRRQLSFAARRFRIAIVLGGIYVIVSTAIRLLFTSGLIAEYGSPIAAVLLMVTYLIVARDPGPASGSLSLTHVSKHQDPASGRRDRHR